MHTWSRSMTSAEFVAASAAAPANKEKEQISNPNMRTIAPSPLLKTDEWNKNKVISLLSSKFHTKYGLDLSWTLQGRTL